VQRNLPESEGPEEIQGALPSPFITYHSSHKDLVSGVKAAHVRPKTTIKLIILAVKTS
jgi:hypothetical protein